jgi:predicted lysophospholipase L1 biosynthesis ABC-type transport system permease subunit
MAVLHVRGRSNLDPLLVAVVLVVDAVAAVQGLSDRWRQQRAEESGRKGDDTRLRKCDDTGKEGSGSNGA